MSNVINRKEYDTACKFCPHVRGEVNQQEGSKRTLLFQFFEKIIPVHCYLWDLMAFADPTGFNQYIEKKSAIPTNCPKREDFRKTGYVLPE